MDKLNCEDKYSDIINMERPRNEKIMKKHPPMTLENRAKIFSSFAALRGYEDELTDEDRVNEAKFMS